MTASEASLIAGLENPGPAMAVTAVRCAAPRRLAPFTSGGNIGRKASDATKH